MNNMIHVFIGTKAQFIKMAPILIELRDRGIEYNLIDTGQHAQLTGDIVRQFGLREPDVKLRGSSENISTLPQAASWTGKLIWRLLFSKQEIYKKIFRGENGVCLIHGDTLTTLISLMYGKRCGLKVAHVEAGLRSYNILHPFPEELIRITAMRFSDILFAPSDWSAKNLGKMGYQDKTVSIGGNTIIDAVRYAQELGLPESRTQKDYVVVTIHRLETIYSSKKMRKVVRILERVSEDHQIVFVMHDPTVNQLVKYDLMGVLEQNQNIILSNLMSYLEFINLISGADFIITDGGSIQEECYFLNKPCLILRERTERQEGLGENAVLSNFQEARINNFLAEWDSITNFKETESIKPSSIIVDYLQE